MHNQPPTTTEPVLDQPSVPALEVPSEQTPAAVAEASREQPSQAKRVGTAVVVAAGLFAPIAHVDIPLPSTIHQGPAIESNQISTAGTQEDTVESIDNVNEAWARLFSQDPHAGELAGRHELDYVTEDITSLRDQGFHIDGIRMTGYASAEDDSVNAAGERTAGLDTPNAKNKALAKLRSGMFDIMLTDRLQLQGIEIPKISLTNGVEDALNKGEIAQIDAYARQFGYKDHTTMIEQYNRTRQTPPVVTAYLDKVLRSQRKVQVVIDASRVSPLAKGQAEEIPTKTPQKHSVNVTIHVPPIAFLEPGQSPETEPIVEPPVSTTPTATDRRTWRQQENRQLPRSQTFTQAARQSKQPRPYNEGKNQRVSHVGRSHSGNRSGKRG